MSSPIERVPQRLDALPVACEDLTSGTGQEFSFGKNWQRFLAGVDESHVEHARRSFTAFTRLASLDGHTFLDIGCGSGLSSLVAHRLGAQRVVSVDLDPRCVRCAEELRGRFAGRAANWEILQGSALDPQFLLSLGRFSYVYSWGVLHHTGAMWSALENAAGSVDAGGVLHIALYNEGKNSRAWHKVKRLCNRWPRTVFPAVRAAYVLYGYGRLMARLESPMAFTREYHRRRGMDFVRDVDDWLGGLPYEYCKPEQAIDFLLERGFTLQRLRTSGSIGNNEFLFRAM
jgi:2-polyprenyl-6-hydroxyphenyl methylase/3-demethylubiquinone-9 3-methyltransferase